MVSANMYPVVLGIWFDCGISYLFLIVFFPAVRLSTAQRGDADNKQWQDIDCHGEQQLVTWCLSVSVQARLLFAAASGWL